MNSPVKNSINDRIQQGIIINDRVFEFENCIQLMFLLLTTTVFYDAFTSLKYFYT